MLTSKLKHWGILLLITVFALLTASCTKHDYASVIPKDATVVTALQLNQLAQDARLSESMAITRMKSLSQLVASGKTQEEVNAILDDPTLLGLDFESPAYLFMCADQSIGLSIRVDDDDRLDDVIHALAKQQLATKPVVRDDFAWTTLFVGIEMAYDDHTALLMLPTRNDVPSTVLKQRMAQYLTQGNEYQFAETDNMKWLDTDDKHPVKIYAHSSALPATLLSWVKTLLPTGVRANQVEMKAAIASEGNKLTLEASLFSSDKETQQKLNAADRDLKTLNGTFLTAAPDDFFLWGGIGCKGKKIVQLLKANKQTHDFLFLLERGIDIERMLSSVDGDLSVILPLLPNNDSWNRPEFILLGELGDKKFLNDVHEWQSTAGSYGITLKNENRAKNNYVMKADGYSLHWGVEEDNLYMASDAAFRMRAFATNSHFMDSLKEDVKKSKWFLCINLSSIDKHTPAWSVFTPAITSVTLSGRKATEIRCTITGREKQQSVLSQLLSHLVP